ncbi:MAG: hypothetical protein AUK49_05505 [Betaproteobacteria bacterium CG2_30_68_42]|nr:MAG: hypothetical protein AUK49_05505 [Betaproteobacteria bacterium CG2_30_68_42]PIX75649.1 MAG: hypothetical protein COZ38_04405 [Rhodocyclales bacterium CG_4_10_14_3_um_filter_68_10]PJA58255.1 MAG: hypothetical protein CO164_03490 [Rhodocyclales bacterium CG_4_9_14_3_um_filter_68_10]
MLVQAVTLALNHLLRAQAWARERLRPHAGSIIRMTMPPWRASWVVNPDGSVAEAAAGAADVEMVLSPWAPLLALRGSEALVKSARVNGSAELADALAFVLRELRWDYEEDLSRVVGDIPAHRIAGLVQGLAPWPARSAVRLGEALAEYLREERPVLVSHRSAGEFGEALDRLRTDLDRIEDRIARVVKGA